MAIIFFPLILTKSPAVPSSLFIDSPFAWDNSYLILEEKLHLLSIESSCFFSIIFLSSLALFQQVIQVVRASCVQVQVHIRFWFPKPQMPSISREEKKFLEKLKKKISWELENISREIKNISREIGKLLSRNKKCFSRKRKRCLTTWSLKTIALYFCRSVWKIKMRTLTGFTISHPDKNWACLFYMKTGNMNI